MSIMNFDDLFEQSASQDKYKEPPKPMDTAMDELMINLEAEFTGAETSYTSRVKERKELNEKLVEVEKKLKAIKNPKNVSQAAKVSAQNNAARQKHRTEIARIKLRLSEIDTEEGNNNNNKEKEGKQPLKNKKNQRREPELKISEQKPSLPGQWDMNPYSDDF